MRSHPSLSMIIKKLLRLATGLLLLLSVAAAVPTCTPPTCTGNLHQYHDMCLTNTAIVYMECTKGRGFDTTKEIGGSVGGTFKVVADATLQLAYKKSQKENKDVSLQIVHDCLKIAGEASDSPDERNVAQTYERQADEYIEQWKRDQVAHQVHIKLSPTSARVGEAVQISGTNFYQNETVDIHLHATLVEQVQADGQGAFRTTIKVPDNAPPPGFSTVIIATGETSAKSARAPFVVTR
jgi:hypothetical protein